MVIPGLLEFMPYGFLEIEATVCVSTILRPWVWGCGPKTLHLLKKSLDEKSSEQEGNDMAIS